ncbi:MAG: DUF1501 domain-containing protein [Pirellulaceae bacterium]|jgi:hypothetical protein|nr:DUF1501 domain-containing protein [Pirellulaceae bacterium]MDP7015857.1 DUF1501 domain-containing protein [Pirellulaceae bacterium]
MNETMRPHLAQPHGSVNLPVSRRTMLVAGGLSFCGMSLPELTGGAMAAPSSSTGKAKTTILIWLSGGASHIDTWDMKPEAPAAIRGPFKSIETSAPGIRLCEHLPLLSKRAHRLAIVRSLGHHRRGTGDHHAGYYYNLTGHRPDPSFPQLLNARKPRPDDWPAIGTVVGYKSPPHPYLPQSITLPMKPGAPEYTRPGQFAARLGVEHDPLYVLGDVDDPMHFAAPAIELAGDVSIDRLLSRRALLKNLNQSEQSFERFANVGTLRKFQKKAFSLLGSSQAKAAFDLSGEPDSVIERYGRTHNGMSMLMARRLTEAGVPFISVFWKGNKKLAEAKNCKSGGGWDTHGNNFICLKDVLLPELDQSFTALLDDLGDRGLLDQTLLMVNSEMGRKPKIGDPRSGGAKGQGRDHWTHSMSVLFAGGGIRGGQAYGTSDRHAAYPADLPVAPEDIAKTVYYSMGITDLKAVDNSGRPYNLMAEGRALAKLF